jgi:hypothetical protein
VLSATPSARAACVLLWFACLQRSFDAFQQYLETRAVAFGRGAPGSNRDSKPSDVHRCSWTLKATERFDSTGPKAAFDQWGTVVYLVHRQELAAGDLLINQKIRLRPRVQFSRRPAGSTTSVSWLFEALES